MIFLTSKSTTVEYALMIVGFKAMARGMLQTQKKEKLISMLVTAGMASYFNYRNKTRLRFYNRYRYYFDELIKIVVFFISINCLADKLDDEDDEDLDSDEDEDEQVSYKPQIVI